jgi:hypothetical protein
MKTRVVKLTTIKELVVTGSHSWPPNEIIFQRVDFDTEGFDESINEWVSLSISKKEVKNEASD